MRAYQAVTTKFLPATNILGSRVKATAVGGSVTLSWDHTLSSEHNHAAAAKKLIEQQGWPGAWHIGALPYSPGYAFVCSDVEGPAFFTKQS